MKILLEGKNLTVSYSGFKAIKDISFYVGEGEIVVMVGPNGAGKSTTLKAISGLLDVTGGSLDSGEILFDGQSIKSLRTDQLVRKGISLVPEGRHLFHSMTVLENLEMGAYMFDHTGKSMIAEKLDEVFNLFPILRERRKQKVGTLSSGEQQLVAIARALMISPRLLLLDEPSLGLSPNYVETVFEKLLAINERGVSILLVEQNVSSALEICHRGYVFKTGSISIEGNQEELLTNQTIKEIYLGL